MSNPVRALVCRVGQVPVVELLAVDDDGSRLAAMQAIVGGSVEVISLDDGSDCWMNEDGIGLGLPLNRRIPAGARGPSTLFGMPVDEKDVIYIEDEDHGKLARPGQAGEWRILGDFFITGGVDEEGETIGVTDEAIALYTKMFASEDPVAAQAMRELRTKLEAGARW